MSKELEALEALKEVREYLYGDVYGGVAKRLDIIENALKENINLKIRNEELVKTNKELLAQINGNDFINFKVLQKLKALNLIKEKRVNVGDFVDTFIVEELSYQHYLDNHDNYSYKLLAQEEYDLLKEVLL